MKLTLCRPARRFSLLLSQEPLGTLSTMEEMPVFSLWVQQLIFTPTMTVQARSCQLSAHPFLTRKGKQFSAPSNTKY